MKTEKTITPAPLDLDASAPGAIPFEKGRSIFLKRGIDPDWFDKEAQKQGLPTSEDAPSDEAMRQKPSLD